MNNFLGKLGSNIGDYLKSDSVRKDFNIFQNYLPAFKTSIETGRNARAFSNTMPTIYYAGDKSGGSFINPIQTAGAMLNQRAYNDKLSANRSAMYAPTFNEDTLDKVKYLLNKIKEQQDNEFLPQTYNYPDYSFTNNPEYNWIGETQIGNYY